MRQRQRPREERMAATGASATGVRLVAWGLVAISAMGMTALRAAE